MKKSMLIGAIVVFALAGSIEWRWGVRPSQRVSAAAEQAEDIMRKTLFRQIEALYREGVKGGEAERFYAAKFYLAEAEVWLASVKVAEAR